MPAANPQSTYSSLMVFVVAMTALSGIPARADVTNVIVNGHFDDDLSGWTIDQDPGSNLTHSFFHQIPGAPLPPFGSGSARYPHPTVATPFAVSSGGFGAAALSQQFTVPDEFVSVTLGFDMFVSSYISPVIIHPSGLDANPDFSNKHARVDLMAANAAPFDTQVGVVRNLYIGADTPNLTSSAQSLPMINYLFDLTNDVMAGETYKIRFGEVASSSLYQGVDNVVLLIETSTVTDAYWQGGPDGMDWDAAGSWSTIEPPNADTNAFIGGPGGPSQPRARLDTTGNVVRDLTVGHDYDNNPNTDDNGQLNIYSELTVNRNLYVGRDQGSGGSIYVGHFFFGPSASLLVEGTAYIGGDEDCPGGSAGNPWRHLSIDTGAVVQVNGGVVVFGNGSGLVMSGGALTTNTVSLLAGDDNNQPKSSLQNWGTIDANVYSEYGSITPRYGDLTITGDLRFDDGEIRILMFEEPLGKLVIGGNVELNGGRLDVRFLPGDTFMVGQSFDILDYGELTGLLKWSDILTFTNGTLPDGLLWDLSELDTQGIITVIPEPTALGVLVIGLLLLPKRKRETP